MQRLDQAMVERKLVVSRSQGESYAKLGKVYVNGNVAKKAGQLVKPTDEIELRVDEQYVSRAGLKLASVAQILHLDFTDKVVLDVGSSTGGFTDFALKNGASKVIAVDVGTNQLHPTLQGHPKIELHEQTDIRSLKAVTPKPDIVVIDVSFISLREILPHVASLSDPKTLVVAMVKPQFEAGREQVNKGVIKNERVRRDILKDFENWVKNHYVISEKADSDVAGSKGNRERFYLLKKSL